MVALIWKWILQENGLLNGIIVSLGYDKLPFLVDAQWARFWVIMISVWAFMGFYTLILLAGLQSIPADLYEAASIDGANEWHAFWSITLPLLMPHVIVVLVLSLIRAVQIFDVVFAFTGGGPGTATLYIVQYIYENGFSSPNKLYGLAASASLLMAGYIGRVDPDSTAFPPGGGLTIMGKIKSFLHAHVEPGDSTLPISSPMFI